MQFLRLCWAATKINIYDLYFIYGSEKFNIIETFPSQALPRRGLWARFLTFFWHIYRIIKARLPKAESVPPGATLFVAFTKNQFDSLVPIQRHTSQSAMSGGSHVSKFKVDVTYPFLWAYLLSIPFFPLVIWHLLNARGYRRRTFAYCLEQYWLAYGYYIVAHLWLARLAPSTLVMSNDHNVPNSTLLVAARAAGIKSIYVQHASVNDRWPPLAFDYALLDGQDALQKYESAGASPTEIFLIGTPKADGYQLRARQQITTVGICTNTLDPYERVDELVQALQAQHRGLDIVLRPHPKDKLVTRWHEMAAKYRLSISDSKNEVSYDFLQRTDLIFAGDSNILLEATLLNIHAIYYDFTQSQLDWYGFRKNGLVDYADTAVAASDLLTTKRSEAEDVRAKAKFYCATVNTEHDGRSTTLAAEIIMAIAAKQVPQATGNWHLVSRSPLTAYELAFAGG